MLNNILIFGDFPGIPGGVIEALEKNEFYAIHLQNIEQCAEVDVQIHFDLIVLSETFNDQDAAQWFAIQRQRGLNTPILLYDTTAVLKDLGTSGPTGPALATDLINKINHHINQIHTASVIHIGTLSIDKTIREARAGSELLHLSTIEFDLLWLLAENRGKVVSTTRCLSAVWGLNHDPQSNRVAVHMKKLRDKLPDKGLIRSQRSVGYVLDIEG